MALNRPPLLDRLAASARTLAGLAPLLLAGAASAEDAAPTLDTGDTAWMLTSSALVLMMTLPGLALFYGGPRAREEHALALHAVHGRRRAWSACSGSWSATASRSREGNAFIGDLSKFGPRRHHPGHALGHVRHPRVPVRRCSRRMFAIITPALMIGAFAERMRFGALPRVHHALAARRVLPARAHGLGRRLDRRRRSARRTSPAASSCTCRAATRRSSPRSSSASARGFGKEPMPPHNLPLRGDRRRACSGSAGSASTPAASSRPTALAGAGLPHHQHRRLDGAAHLDGDRVDPPRQADRARRGHRRRRRPRRDHARPARS